MDVSDRAISRIARKVSKFTNKAMRRQGVGPAEFDLVQTVRCHPGLTQAELCRFLEIDKGAAARQIANAGNRTRTIGAACCSTPHRRRRN